MSDNNVFNLFDFEEPVREKTHACPGMTCQVCHGRAAAGANEAIKRGSKAADPEWVQAAETAIHTFANGGSEFTTDEVMESLNMLGVETHDPRALGGVVRRFLNKGLIREVGTTKSRRRHGARIPIYLGITAATRAEQRALEPDDRRNDDGPSPDGTYPGSAGGEDLLLHIKKRGDLW